MTQRPWHLGWALKNGVGADDTPDKWSSGLCLNHSGTGNSLPWMTMDFHFGTDQVAGKCPLFCSAADTQPTHFRSLSHTRFQSPRDTLPATSVPATHFTEEQVRPERGPGSRLRVTETDGSTWASAQGL